MSTSFADRLTLVATAAVVAFAVVARLHDVAAYPAMYDYDASSHAVNVVDFLELRLPDVHTWGGSHPPLYYAVGAALCGVLPATLPMHVTLRLVSAFAWMIAVACVWRSLRRGFATVDAAVVGALLLGVPGIVIVTCMMTNDTLAALLVIATVTRLVDVSGDDVPTARHAAATGALAGLAALTKASGIAAIVTALGFYAWPGRRAPRRALATVLAAGIVSAAIAGPHYARLFHSLSGSTYHVIGTRAGSPEKVAVENVIYAAVRERTNERFPSLPWLLHVSLWGDPMFAYLPGDPGRYGDALALAGVGVAALAAAGAVRVLVRRELRRRFGVAFAFGALYVAALVPVVRLGPYMVLTKTNYLLPLALPAGIALAAGLERIPRAVRAFVRWALLAVATAGIMLTWYGWWGVHAAPAPAPPAAAGGGPAAVVERYFEDRARDPIRALLLLAPEAQRAHALTLVGILRIPFRPAAAGDPAPVELARARMAWLELYNLVRWMQPIAAALEPSVLGVEQAADTAEVRVRVATRDATPPPSAIGMGPWPFRPFEQDFALRRAARGWKVTRMEQRDVADDDAVAAFVAAPTLAGLDRVRALGWKPGWEDSITAGVRATETAP